MSLHFTIAEHKTHMLFKFHPSSEELLRFESNSFNETIPTTYGQLQLLGKFELSILISRAACFDINGHVETILTIHAIKYMFRDLFQSSSAFLIIS